ncbi:hypothetical protein ACT7DC_03130 [Bacillus cereus]
MSIAIAVLTFIGGSCSISDTIVKSIYVVYRFYHVEKRGKYPLR